MDTIASPSSPRPASPQRGSAVEGEDLLPLARRDDGAGGGEVERSTRKRTRKRSVDPTAMATARRRGCVLAGESLRFLLVGVLFICCDQDRRQQIEGAETLKERVVPALLPVACRGGYWLPLTAASARSAVAGARIDHGVV
jgi:hypothetical protein